MYTFFNQKIIIGTLSIQNFCHQFEMYNFERINLKLLYFIRYKLKIAQIIKYKT